MPVAGLFCFGIAVGLLSGMLGIGGGVVLVPGLILLFGFSQIEAQGTSLAVLSVPVVLFAAMVYYRAGLVQVPVVACICAGLALGAYCGAWLVPVVPHHLLRPVFGTLLLYVGLLFVLDVRSTASAAMLPVAIATAALALVARLFRRRWRRRHPLQGEWEYHI
ncbi:MAG TPA: sulfite exporter TauE/SafE family protein [Pirellulales bacterium]|jgi:hypothetical protein|nr:sulfite exporter TauE/SafE family protein [Pirellulales bacterium]